MYENKIFYKNISRLKSSEFFRWLLKTALQIFHEISNNTAFVKNILTVGLMWFYEFYIVNIFVITLWIFHIWDFVATTVFCFMFCFLNIFHKKFFWEWKKNCGFLTLKCSLPFIFLFRTDSWFVLFYFIKGTPFWIQWFIW